MKNIRQKFKKSIIEAIHGLPYEKAILKEDAKSVYDKYVPYHITLGRVMQAMKNGLYEKGEEQKYYDNRKYLIDNWKLTKENGQECTDDDQTDETIKKLSEVIK